MMPGVRLDQLGRDAHPVARAPRAALEHVAHAELAPDLLHRHGAPLVGEARIAGDDEEPAILRQRRDQVLAEPIGEVFLIRVLAHVGERQHGDRRPIGQRQGALAQFRHRQRRLQRPVDRVDVDRPRDVLEAVLAARRAAEGHLVLDLLAHRRRDADLLGLGQSLQPRRDVDAVAEQIAAARHHVAQIEADPEHHLPVLGEVAIAARGHALDRHRAAHRLHRAGELGHDPVAGEIEDPALVLGDECRDHLLVGRQRLDGAVLVQRHQPAVADDVRRQDDGETAIGFHDGHRRDPDCEA